MKRIRKFCLFLILTAIGLSMSASDCYGPYDAPVMGLASPAPQWSPDGTNLVLKVGGSLYYAHADGTQVVPVYESDEFDSVSQVSISPDGSRMVYAKGYGKYNNQPKYELVSSALDGSEFDRITDNDSLEIAPVWSPDGSRIAFLSNRLKDPDGWSLGFRLFTMAPDGSDVRVAAPDVVPTLHPPAWSPDGQYLAFMHDETIPYTDSSGDSTTVHRRVAYAVRWDGAGLTRLAEVFSAPVWSPDGTRLTFLAGFPEIPKLQDISVDGSELRTIAEFPRYGAIAPSEWSPDGTELRGSLSTFNVSESKFGRFTKRWIVDGWQLRSVDASWSPDGSRIAVLAFFEKGTVEKTETGSTKYGTLRAWVIFTMRPDGSDKRVLLRDYGTGALPGGGAPLPAHFDGFELEEITID